MKNLILLIGLIQSSQASVFDGVFAIRHDYACLDLDGIPIQQNTALASTCCSNGSVITSNPTCRNSIVTNTQGPANIASGGVTLAQNSIQGTQNLAGASTTFNTETPQVGDNGVNIQSDSSAMVAETANGTSDTGNEGSLKSAVNSASASGSRGSSGGAGGFVGLGVGSAGGTSGVNPQGKGMSGKDSAGGYAGAKGGKVGNGYDKLYGMNGSGASGTGAISGEGGDYQLGESGSGQGLAGGAQASSDDESNGSSEDPSDYFNRTNKGDDIFKIVSARYMKKKSLWTIPQKLPQKKI